MCDINMTTFDKTHETV